MNAARSSRPWWRDGGQRILTAVALTATLGTLGLIGLNAALLSRMTSDVQVAQDQSAALNNAAQEMVRLLQKLAEFGETANLDELTIQRGLLGRQIHVSTATFPAGAPEVRELEQIWAAVSAFDWDALPERGGHDSPLRAEGMVLLDPLERRLNTVRSASEKTFYTTTIESLAAKRRSQTALGVLVSLVLALGTASLVTLTRRRRSDIAEAYDALKDEVGERRAAEEALRASEGRFRSLVQRASDLTVVTDDGGTVTYVSPAAEALLGYTPEELVHRSLLTHVDPGQRAVVEAALRQLADRPGAVQTIELRLHTQDGRIRSVEAVCQNLLADPDVSGLVWNGRDVTERRALEDELTRQAHHDSLTGLPNRALLLTRLGEARTSSTASPGQVSVVLVDLDGFKNVNDTFGHSAGDELLQRAAERLRGCVLTGDMVARLGGDEFAIVVASGKSEHAVAVARRVVDALGQPITVGGQEMSISASVGVAHRTGAESAQDLLRDADIAMYVAKNTGKSHYEVFEPDMRARASARTSLQQHLVRAVELGEIEVHYQPIVDLGTDRTVSLEALARWRHPDGSMVPPDVFIPIAEDCGAILGIGREVLRQACQAAREWRAIPGQDDLGIAVNVSVHQVLSGYLVEHVTDALRVSGLAASSLTLEIIESTLLEPSDRVAAEFARLKALGVRIAVDDFGSGYSSLGFLMSLDADVLKIDRTLLDFDTTRQGSLVQAISELGRTLGLTVVVEGVETLEHLARARDALCDQAQGYFFARPMVPGDVPEFLDSAQDLVAAAVHVAG